MRNTLTTAAILAPVLTLTLIACQSTSSTPPAPDSGAAQTASVSVATNPAARASAAQLLDPITGDPIQGEGFAAYYGQWKVLFNSRSDAALFAALSKEKRAAMAAPQVLAAKGITNSVCPLTGEPLTAAAAPVKYEGEVIGLATVADANQFKALPKPKQAALISEWKASAAK